MWYSCPYQITFTSCLLFRLLDHKNPFRSVIEVVAHRLSTVRHAHQICVLDKGKLAESGTHDETCQKSLLQEAIWLADRVRGVFNRCSGDSCFGAYVWFVPKELIRKEGAYEKLLRLQLSVMTEDFWTAVCVKTMTIQLFITISTASNISFHCEAFIVSRCLTVLPLFVVQDERPSQDEKATTKVGGYHQVKFAYHDVCREQLLMFHHCFLGMVGYCET